MVYLPDGVQDFLPEEYRFKHSIEEKLRNTFIKCGYEEVMPPTFEYSGNFTGKTGLMFDENNLYRFFDKKGSILTLRPDVTTQIARIAATKLGGVYPLKLCYIANVYRYDDPQVGKMREFTQAGVELIGVNHEVSDAECIAVAIEALKNIGLEDFKVDIGQVEFFKAVLEELKLDKQNVFQLKGLLEQKNQSGIDEFLEKNNIKGLKQQYISELPLLFGGYEIIDRAKTVYKSDKAKRALDYLDRVYKILKDFGMGEYITFDLGMVQSINYYTGLIFRCFVKGIGYAICTGGRYDNLSKNFDSDMPATGFAVSVERAMLALQKQGMANIEKPYSVLIKHNERNRRHAYEYAVKLRSEGKIVEMCDKCSNEYIKRKNFDEIIDLGE